MAILFLYRKYLTKRLSVQSLTAAGVDSSGAWHMLSLQNKFSNIGSRFVQEHHHCITIFTFALSLLSISSTMTREMARPPFSSMHSRTHLPTTHSNIPITSSIISTHHLILPSHPAPNHYLILPSLPSTLLLMLPSRTTLTWHSCNTICLPALW